MSLRVVCASVIGLLWAGVCVLAQETAELPFVGCESDVQGQYVDAPRAAIRVARIASRDAAALAYYESGDGVGVIAPRGWHCQGNHGSGGYGLQLSPQPLDPSSNERRGRSGAAIEIFHVNGENSGMYEIAEMIAVAFPEFRAMARSTWNGLDTPFPSRQHPNDKLTIRGRTVVEYKTAAGADGIGTKFSQLLKSNRPISGMLALVRGPGNPDAFSLAVLASLTSTCRRHEVDPQLYLTQLLVNLPSQRVRGLPDWLPDEGKRNSTPRPA